MVFLLTFLGMVTPFAGFAQTTSGKIVGYVYDTKGAGVADAIVSVVNETDRKTNSIRTDARGNYVLPNLAPGRYTIAARAKGYVVAPPIAGFVVQLNLSSTVRSPNITLRQVTLNGRVIDRASHLLANARVTARHADDNVTRMITTDAYGNYRIEDLPTGDYFVRAEYLSERGLSATIIPVSLSRFNEQAPDIQLNDVVVDGQTPTPPSATPAAIDGNQAIELVRTFDAALSSNFDERQIESLPLGGATMRSFDDLALLAPGVAPPPYTPGVRGPGIGFGIGTAGEFSVNGSRARANNFSVDGSDNNDPDVGVRRQGFVARVPQAVESIKDFSIATLLWNAELGRNVGSQVNAVSKYGGEKFHGQAYAFFTDSRLNARNFFDYTGGPSGGKDPFTHTQAGFVLGGPLTKKGNAAARTNFFTSYEHQSIQASTEQHFGTPSRAERTFLGLDKLTSLIPGGVNAFGVLLGSSPVTFKDVTPLGRNLFSFYPLPNNPGGPFETNTFTQILPADGRGDIFSFKVTHEPAANHVYNARYNFTDDDRTLPSINHAIDSTLQVRTRSQNLSLIMDDALGPRTFNQARFSFGRTRLETASYPDNPFIFSQSSQELLDFGSGARPVRSQTGPIGQLIIEPFSPVGVDVTYFPQRRASNTFQYADALSLMAAGHALRLGGNIRHYQLNSSLDRLYRPQVVYAGGLIGTVNLQTSDPTAPPFSGVRSNAAPITGAQLASLGIPSAIQQTITSGLPDSTIGLRFTEYHVFINDNWRLRPNLVVDYGLRYEYNSVPHEVNDRIERALRLADLPAAGASRFDTQGRTDKFNAAINAYQSALAGRGQIYEPDRNNFSPHVGFAWSPGRDARTAIRAGYGIYYDTILGAVVSQSRNLFPNEIPINVDPSFLGFNFLSLNNPAFLQIVKDGQGRFTNPVFLLQPGACNQFGTCNQFGGARQDFVALIGQLFSQNLGGGLAFTLTDKNLRTPYVQQWHLTVEREWFGDYLISASYVGTKGTKLTRLTTPNGGPNVLPFIPIATSIDDLPQSTPVIFPPFIGSGLTKRTNTNLGAYQIYENSAASNYHALQLEARKRYSRGLQFTAAYTLSHAIDDVSDVFPIAGAPILAQDQHNYRAERASASFDMRQRLAASLIWDLPFWRNARGGLGRWLGGWQVASIFQAHSGQPYTLTMPFDVNLDGNLSDRPFNIPNGLVYLSGHGRRRVAIAPGHTVSDFAPIFIPQITFPGDPGGFVIPFGDSPNARVMGRNTVRGDSLINLDLSLNKVFRITETQSLDFRVESFNLMNRANFGLPARVLGAPGFGSAIDTVTPGRVIQLALKYRF
jgi:hypothetical protein